jgi:ABC-2 type transport system ATP-binding protein
MITIDNLSFAYGKKKVLNAISLAVNDGELFGLLGANGAGKTTLISILNGLLPCETGHVKICGKDLKTQIHAIQKDAALIPQTLAFYPNLSAYENLEYFGSLYGLKGKKLQEKIDEVIAITSLNKVKDDLSKHYSGGLKRRLNIAIGLLHEPKIIYFDEPTVGIDPQSRNYILQMIRRINKEKNTTIVYTSHYMEEVAFLCDTVAVIDGGKVLKRLEKKDFVDAKTLETIFLELTDSKLRD